MSVFLKNKNYSFCDYTFEKTTIRYIIIEETKNCFMIMFPSDMKDLVCDEYKTVQLMKDFYPDNRDWRPGSLVHIHLGHHMNSMYDNSFKFSPSTFNLTFESQNVIEKKDKTIIETVLASKEGYKVKHTLINYIGENGFEVKNKFINNTGRKVKLELITSASLDCLSPFSNEDGSKDIVYHTFKGGWATEGKQISLTLPEMNMEKSWGGSYESEKIGSIGSKTVGRYYPYVAIEDKKNNCIWGMKIKHNATWQAELTRCGTPLSLSIGLGDMQFGAWFKYIENGESFESPTAYIAVAKGGIDVVSNDLIEMNSRDIENYGEEGMPIVFNDWVTHWGDTSHKKLISLANSLKETKVKYFVVDDGWQHDENGSVIGDWTLNQERFPNGLKAYCDEIRNMGFIPGIWFEFESVRQGAKRYLSEYDALYLKKDGTPIQTGVANTVPTKFLDFKNPKVMEWLDKCLIKVLKENGFGYLKVDYNANIGLGCDGAESLGEGLRLHMQEVYQFFCKIKKEIPDIIIENCSSGGSRLEPMMMGVSAMSSFSDAHECFELPVIAANMHYLVAPRQSQIWCVLKSIFDDKHMQYIIAAGFLGRLCWSGQIDRLNPKQYSMLLAAEEFYEKVSHIIKHGRSKIYRTHFINNREPEGTQVVTRIASNQLEMLVVCHYFNNAIDFEIELDDFYTLSNSLYDTKCYIEGKKLKIVSNSKSADVFHLIKR